MATTQTAPRQQPFLLSYEPTEYSLHRGTTYEIPAEELARPQTPTLTKSMPGAFPPTPEREKTSADVQTHSASTTEKTRVDSAAPLSPASNGPPMTPPRRPREGVRRLFSLSNLRKSFSSSRTSLNVPRTSHDARPTSPGLSVVSTTASMQSPLRPPDTPAGGPGTLRNKRSSGWFKRQSGFFNVNEDGMLEVVNEDANRPATRESKRLREANIPHLPEVSALRGGDLNDGGLGWDEAMFKT